MIRCYRGIIYTGPVSIGKDERSSYSLAPRQLLGKGPLKVLSDSGKEFVAGHRLRQPQISILSVMAVARLFLGRTVLPEDPQPLATFFLRSSDIGLGTLTSRDSLHARQKAASRAAVSSRHF